MTVTLGDLRKRVDARVKSGAYASASEVMRAAVRVARRTWFRGLTVGRRSASLAVA